MNCKKNKKGQCLNKMNKNNKKNNNSNDNLFKEEGIHLRLHEIYEKKREYTLKIFESIKKDLIDNVFNKQNTIEDENKHREILFNNFRTMMLDGDAIFIKNKETTPFKTLILNFDETNIYEKIIRNKRICADGQIRDNSYDYIQYLIEGDKNNFEKICKEESKINEILYEKRDNKMLDHLLKQISDEYPEYYEYLYFYHQKEFYPIHLFTIIAKLKI